MKDLINKALSDAIILLEKRVPQTKILVKSSESILDVSPLSIVSFMKDHDIPDNAYFDGIENSYDAWDGFVLKWEINIPTTETDKLKYKKYHFTSIAFKSVSDLLTKNGYKRITPNPILKASNTTIYDVYINNDIDRLVEYYSLYFKPV